MKITYPFSILTLMLLGCNNKPKTPSESTETCKQIGLEYIQETAKLLGKNLIEAIQKEDTFIALEFCKLQALPLTERFPQNTMPV